MADLSALRFLRLLVVKDIAAVPPLNIFATQSARLDR